MLSWDDTQRLFSIIDVELIDDDFIVPDGEDHVIWIRLNWEPGRPTVPFNCKGYQWDFMYWMWRLNENDWSYKDYLVDYIGNIYRSVRHSRPYE